MYVRDMAHEVTAAYREQGRRYRHLTLAIIVPENNDLYRILYFVHLFSAIAAFGPLFLYPRLQRAGETEAIARMHMRFVFPAWHAPGSQGMGMAQMEKISLTGTPFITATIVLWLVALVVSWFLIRPALSEPDESAKSKLSTGVGITHLILVVSMYLMIFKPGGYSFTLSPPSSQRRPQSAEPPMTRRPSASSVAYGL